MHFRKKKRPYKKIAMALSLCALIVWGLLGTGASLAWFSDASPEIDNIFHFADFDLKVEHRVDGGTWAEVDAQTKVFDEHALYEPGYTQVVCLRVKNNGTADFNFQTALQVTQFVYGINAWGQPIYLQEYLKFGVIYADSEAEMNVALQNRNRAKAVATTKLGNYDGDGKFLAGGAEKYIALVVHMPENVGNVANYRGDIAPELHLGLIVTANQLRE